MQQRTGAWAWFAQSWREKTGAGGANFIFLLALSCFPFCFKLVSFFSSQRKATMAFCETGNGLVGW